VYNHSKLCDLNVPVVNIVVFYTSYAKAAEVSTKEAGNLHVRCGTNQGVDVKEAEGWCIERATESDYIDKEDE
jgi:hypothetical protein